MNFALIEIQETPEAEEGYYQGNRRKRIIQELGKRGILVRDCGNFHGLEGEFIRVAIKDRGSMSSLLETLKAIQV